MNPIAHMISYNIHVNGEDEYHLIIPNAGSDARENKTAFAMYSFVSHFMIYPNTCNHLHRWQQLFHQYAIDMYAQIESERLGYRGRNQKVHRSEEHAHLNR